jgi:uncharacterized protein (TIGR03437 family)
VRKANKQGTFAGLDQVNVPIPSSLAGAGSIAVTLTAGRSSSNTVYAIIK